MTATYEGLRGWMPGIDHVGTTQYGYSDVDPETMTPTVIINHIMQGYARTMIEWANTNSVQKSAHFVIDRAGNITQTVSIYSPAWHAGRVVSHTWPAYPGGNPNKYSIGLEHEGFSVDPGYGYDYIYDAANDDTGWPEAMIAASVRVHQWIAGELGITLDTLNVIGHNETDSVSRANDPGPAWSKTQLLAMINGDTPEVADEGDRITKLENRIAALEALIANN